MGEILIKNVEMPKHCAMCGFHGAISDPMISQHFCKITGERILNPYKDRLDNCQLIYVPPHGRLIDVDTAYEQFLNLMDTRGAINPCQLGTILVDAPIIIEAE